MLGSSDSLCGGLARPSSASAKAHLAARTHPVVPPPTTITSYFFTPANESLRPSASSSIVVSPTLLPACSILTPGTHAGGRAARMME